MKSLRFIPILLAGCLVSTAAFSATTIEPEMVIGAPAVQFTNIDSITVDSQGNLFVSDIGEVKRFTSHGKVLPPIGKGVFVDEVIGVAITADGELLAVDQGAYKVRRFDQNGIVLGSFGSKGAGKGEFLDPQGIVLDHDGLIYVSDQKRNDIQVFSPKGEYLYAINSDGSKAGGMHEPESMAIRGYGLFVADEGNRRILKFSLRGQFLQMVPDLDDLIEKGVISQHPNLSDIDRLYARQPAGDIEGMAFDAGGRLYFLEEDTGVLHVYNGEERIGSFASTIQISSGDGVAIDSKLERLYVVDQKGEKVQAFSLKEIYQSLNIR